VRSASLLKLANKSRKPESGGSFDKRPSSRFRTTPGFAGPAGTFFSDVEGAADSATERESSGVSRGSGARRDRTCLGEGERSSDGRDLLDPGMFSRLDEAN
jgi:hypothetical protein